MTALAALLALSLAAGGAPSAKPRLLLLDITAASESDAETASAITVAIAGELTRRGLFDVITTRDVASVMGLERQKKMLGCSDESSSCLAELAGALDTRIVLSGSLSRLGDVLQLSLQTVDSAKAKVLSRTTRIAPNLASLREIVPYAVAEATGSPLPPPPSRVLPLSLIGAGGASVLGGAVLGILALTHESEVNRELAIADRTPQVLRTLADYQRDVADTAAQRTWSLVTIGAGAALVGAGIYLFPSDPLAPARVAVVPAGTGVAVVGAWR